MTTKPCKDCFAEHDGVEPKSGWRPAPHPGPRCVTHHRAEKKRRSANGHARMIEKTYGITAEQYRLLLDVLQPALLGNTPGTCAICGRANGATKRLAVDHDHETGRPRGVACGWCNLEVLGRLDLAALKRAVKYLENPPGHLLTQSTCEKDVL